MKHLKRYNESNDSSFTKEDLEDVFAHSFDKSNDHSVDNIYFNPKNLNDWSTNIYEFEYGGRHPGYQIVFYHSFYNEPSLEKFEKYSDLISEIRSDIERFKGMYKVSRISFDLNSIGTDTLKYLTLIIKP